MKENFRKILSSAPNDISEELLLRYVEGSVSPEERRRIEERLADDPFLSDAIDGLMGKKDLLKHRSILQDIHTKIERHASARMFRILPPWSVVQIAAAVVVIVMGIWFANYLIRKPYDKLFTEEFKPYPAESLTYQQNISPAPSEVSASEPKAIPKNSVPSLQKSEDSNASAPAPAARATPLSSSQPVPDSNVQTHAVQEFKTKEITSSSPKKPDSMKGKQHFAGNKVVLVAPAVQQSSIIDSAAIQSLNDALALYRSGKYQQAIIDFESILKSDSLNEVANFYCGVSYLAIRDADHALEKLKPFSNNRVSQYYEAALWYGALGYLHKNEKDASIQNLEKIISLHGKYQSQAEDLLRQLQE